MPVLAASRRIPMWHLLKSPSAHSMVNRATALPVLLHVHNAFACRGFRPLPSSERFDHRCGIKAVAASSLSPSQIFRSSSKQTTFCADALLNDLGDASVFDGERVVVCVAHFLRHVVQPTETVR